MKIQLCMVASAAVLLMAAVSFPAKATPITWVLSNASATFGPDTVDLSGNFTVTGSAPSPADITASCSGPTCSTLMTVNPETFDTIIGGSPAGITLSTTASGDLFDLGFTTPLDTVIPSNPLVSVVITRSGNHVFADAVFGAAVPAAIPEPSSLALLTGVLGLFLLTRRAHRPDRAA